ncbi:MAG: hypothetical protein ACP5K2_09835 [bacterium]
MKDINPFIYHKGIISGGPIVEELKDYNDPYTEVIYEVVRDGEKKVYSILRSLPEWNGGKIAWVRGTLPFELNGENIQFKNPLPAKIPRFLLGLLGYSIEQSPDNFRNS